jgi:hypothetical protein
MRRTIGSLNDSEIAKPMDILLGGAPVLSSIELYGMYPLKCRPPIGAVTHLKLRGCGFFTPQSFSEFLQPALLSSLTQLSLEWIFVHFAAEEPFPINLPALVCLKIRYAERTWAYDNDFQNLWVCLSMPALETLSLSGLSHKQLDICMMGLRRQRKIDDRFNLKSLCLETKEIVYPPDVIWKSCPDIAEFSLMGAAANPILEFIFDNTANPKSFATGLVWPSLRRLTVSWRNDELLRAVILARKAAGSPIEELCLHDSHSTHERD